jgi:Tfp pilus assembly protein PilP
MKSAMAAVSRVFVLAVLVLAAGCGGDDRQSREEFVSQAEAICENFDQRVNELDEPESADDVKRYVNEVRPVIEDGLSELKGLQPPAEFEEQWDELVAQNDASLEALDDLAQAAEDGDEALFEEITQDASRRDEASDRIAQELGLQKCAS